MKRRKWTKFEDDVLHKYYPDGNFDKIYKLTGRDRQSVYNRVRRIKISSNCIWTNEEVALLYNVYPHYTNKYLSTHYFKGRTSNQIKDKAISLGIRKSKEKSVKWYDREELLLALKEACDADGNPPFSTMLSVYGLPSEATYRRYFGSYSAACEMIGAMPNVSNIFGTPCYSINRDFCFSRAEKAITDYLITQDIPYEKDALYSKFINDERCSTKTVDWVLTETNTFVEYFGMLDKDYYFEKVENKREICRDNNISLIEITPRYFNKEYLDGVFIEFIK